MFSQHMSSPPDELRPMLQAATIDVAENSLFAFCDVIDATVFNEALRKNPTDWLHATVGFRGPWCGDVAVDLPATLARSLAAALLGGAPEDLGADTVHDFSGELANMACGAWLTQAFPAQAFDLTPPAVSNAQSGDADTGDRSVLLTMNDEPVRVTLTWHADEGKRA